MSLISESELKKQINDGEFSNLYLIYGNEPYLKEFYSSRIISKAVKSDFAAFNLHIFEGEETSIAEVANCVESFPMMDERTCVVVKDLNLSSLNQSQNELLEKMMEDVPETTVLVFLMQNIDVDFKRNEKWKNAVRLFEKNGSVAVLDRKTIGEIKKLLVSGAKKRGCEMNANTAEYMVYTVGDDLNLLLNELEKLCFFCKNRSIEKKDIDEIVTKSTEASVFDLAKMIAAGNRNQSFKKLNNLIKQKTDPININSALIGAYTDMYRAKVYLTSGFSAEEAAKYYNYKNKEFRLRSGGRDASKMNLEQLRQCLDILSNTDLRLKSTSTDKTVLLEETIVKLMLTANGEKI